MSQTYQHIIDALSAANKQQLTDTQLQSLMIELRQWDDEREIVRSWLQSGTKNPRFQGLNIAGKMVIGDPTNANIVWDPSTGKMTFNDGTAIVGRMDGGAITQIGSNVVIFPADGPLTLTHGVPKIATFARYEYDDSGFTNLVADNTKITIPMSGGYSYGLYVTYREATATHPIFTKAYVLWNGSYSVLIDQRDWAVGSEFPIHLGNTDSALSAGDYLQLVLENYDSIDHTIYCNMWIRKIR